MTTKEADQKAEIQETRMERKDTAHNSFPNSKARGQYPPDLRWSAYYRGPWKATPLRDSHPEYKGQILVFKHAIATIEIVDEPKGYQGDSLGAGDMNCIVKSQKERLVAVLAVKEW